MRRLDNQLETELIDVSRHLAEVARSTTNPVFRSSGLTAENKSGQDFDPVTIADRKCEQAMRNILSQRRPNDAILGEEFSNVEGDSGLTWILDPIDGTRSFVSGAPVWGVLICVSDEKGPLYGIIDQPYIGERFEGGFGNAIMRGPRGIKQLKTRNTSSLQDAILFTTMPEIGTPQELLMFKRVSESVTMTRYGLDCYSYALLALGQIDLVIEAGLQAYDIQAPIAVVEAAGGIATDWEGQPAHEGGRVIAAANKDIHVQALTALNWNGIQN